MGLCIWFQAGSVSGGVVLVVFVVMPLTIALVTHVVLVRIAPTGGPVGAASVRHD